MNSPLRTGAQRQADTAASTATTGKTTSRAVPQPFSRRYGAAAAALGA